MATMTLLTPSPNPFTIYQDMTCSDYNRFKSPTRLRSRVFSLEKHLVLAFAIRYSTPPPPPINSTGRGYNAIGKVKAIRPIYWPRKRRPRWKVVMIFRPIYCPRNRRHRWNVYQGSPPHKTLHGGDGSPLDRSWLFCPFTVLGPTPYNTTGRGWIAIGKDKTIRPIYCPR